MLPHLIDVWLLDICHALGSRLTQLILQRLLCSFQVVLLQEGENGLQVQVQGLSTCRFNASAIHVIKIIFQKSISISPIKLWFAFTCIVEDSTSCAVPPSPGSAFTSVLICCSLTLTWLEAEPGEMAGERWGDGAKPGTQKFELVAGEMQSGTEMHHLCTVPRVFGDGATRPDSRGDAWLERLFWKSLPSRLPPPWGS